MAGVPTNQKRQRLSADRVLNGALALADEIGIDAFTIRKLADALETKPMTIYHHIPNKEAIVDGMVDRVFAEIDLPPDDLDWVAALRLRCDSAREVLARHPWAAPLMDSRTNPGPATLTHHDAVLGCLRSAGISLQLTAHAYALLDSYIYGFALQEASLPATSGDNIAEAVEIMPDEDPAQYPYLTELATEHLMQPDYDFGTEFEFGINLILNGLKDAAKRESKLNR